MNTKMNTKARRQTTHNREPHEVLGSIRQMKGQVPEGTVKDPESVFRDLMNLSMADIKDINWRINLNLERRSALFAKLSKEGASEKKAKRPMLVAIEGLLHEPLAERTESGTVEAALTTK